MRPVHLLIPATAALLFLLSGISVTSGCNKALCASDVSKCLIQVRNMSVVFGLVYLPRLFSIVRPGVRTLSPEPADAGMNGWDLHNNCVMPVPGQSRWLPESDKTNHYDF